MDPLSVTASIIAVLDLSVKVLGYLNDVKDASKDRAKCAVEASNVHSLLTSLRFRLEEASADVPWFTNVRALNVVNGPLDQFNQALEELQTKMTDGSRLKKASKALVWKFKKEEITSILDRIERLKTLIGIALQDDHHKLSQAIKDDTHFVRTLVPAIQSGVDKIQQEQVDARHSKIVNWISPTNYPAQQSDIIRRRQKGTGQWFLDAPEFTRWLNEPSGTLFCSGIPGAGKTMVAAIAIDHLLNSAQSAQSSSVGVAYVYCNYKAQEEQDASTMLAALVKQLVQGRPSIAESVEQLHKQHADQGTKPSLDEISGVLREVVAKYAIVYVIVDALDECRDSDGARPLFLDRLRILQKGRDIRFLATSRFIPEMEDEFRNAMKLEIKASDEDVRQYVAGQTHRLPRCIQSNPTLLATMQDKLVEAVDGMFLLARLHTDSLLDKRTVKGVKLTLDRLSKGSEALEDAYKEAFRRIDRQLHGDRERAKKVLSWITYARRPLTTEELRCALAVERGEAKLDPDNIPYVEDLLSACTGLVVVDQESGIVRLVHYTTQEYFERIRKTWYPDGPLQIASACLTYLSFDQFKTGSCSTDDEYEARLSQNSFLDYAAKYWGEHVGAVEKRVSDSACSFLRDTGSLSCVEQVLLVPTYGGRVHSQNFPVGTNLHMIARFGLCHIARILLGDETTDIVNAVDSGERTVLSIAAEFGHDKLVKLLLEHGADIDAQGGLYGSALCAASANGHKQTVEVLLNQGANIDAQGGYNYSSALHAASSNGQEQIVRVLLDKGANINTQGKNSGDALRAASVQGSEQIVRMLLDNGAVVNAQGGFHDDALCGASANGHEHIVKMLLERGADVNTQGGNDVTALCAASGGGYEQIVNMLLDQGANVNVQGGYNGNALYVASDKGYDHIVKILLDKGADVNAQSGHCDNALQVASLGGHKHIIKMLLDKGVNVNARSRFYGDALCAASERGYKEIVMLLLDKGANVNGQDGDGALYKASRGGYQQIVEMLLNHGADVNGKGAYDGNALETASENGYERIVQLLLDTGANVNTRDSKGALYKASRKGHEQIVKMLLNMGADVNAQGGYEGSALQAASGQGHKAIVELLLSKGAKINGQGGPGGNALQLASYGGYEEIVELLLDNGADIDAYDGGCLGNALQAASYGGHETTVKLLLDNGADVNAQYGENCSNALQAASYAGYEGIVKLLLENGAEVNAQG